ncbi:phage recombination protein Bet [Fimbriimonas ginsengisoli]|uniref:Prophage LambdaCh01, recombination protein Bet n=1 Tax=Fimbriimonas ginsengisoli Gsoil 348 TaxID=661478 RepID=A0A068NSN4_FIMGI|nr:phage recombination protein Bet [Fimbriimonas ginsengisoli]AIE86367.1 prophage LambdaCh01, recombination protein Bet [Fimbriimonas ginsengisoli Gsoil 348]
MAANAATQTAEILRISPLPVEPQPDWEAKIDLIKRTVAAGATHDELELFFHQARRAGLDPLAKQIYFVKRKGKGVIQVGIDGLRLIADRTGKYAGSDDAEFEGASDRGYPSKAKVTVYKMVSGQRCAFSATARWDEYYPGDDQGFQWRKMPHAMLAKCAEALALRKAFPSDMSGLYIHEEMEQADLPAPEPASRVERDPNEILEGRALADVASRAFAEPVSAPKTAESPEGKIAFGYVPVRWPMPKMFTDPLTDSQRKMMASKARERMIPEEDVPTIRHLVMEAYGLEDDSSKAVASLFIDWLINADEEHLDMATAAAEAINAGEPLDLD